MTREEILILLRYHVSVLAGHLQVMNSVPNRVLMTGGGGEGGVERINELMKILPEPPKYPDGGE